mmetsp:Transcript_27154/g.78010  ORF Transcript_27154/g.78010 Transcript_27154/m.78010 type:complete len:267 (-) Transcript_27154:178-978(-)
MNMALASTEQVAPMRESFAADVEAHGPKLVDPRLQASAGGRARPLPPCRFMGPLLCLRDQLAEARGRPAEVVATKAFVARPGVGPCRRHGPCGRRCRQVAAGSAMGLRSAPSCGHGSFRARCAKVAPEVTHERPGRRSACVRRARRRHRGHKPGAAADATATRLATGRRFPAPQRGVQLRRPCDRVAAHRRWSRTRRRCTGGRVPRRAAVGGCARRSRQAPGTRPRPGRGRRRTGEGVLGPARAEAQAELDVLGRQLAHRRRRLHR